jgi:hypothetical protein
MDESNAADLAASGRESPHPNTQYRSDDQGDHADPHWYLMRADHHLRVFHQAHDVSQGEKGKKRTRNA